MTWWSSVKIAEILYSKHRSQYTMDRNKNAILSKSLQVCNYKTEWMYNDTNTRAQK